MKHLFFFTALACALTAHAAQPHDSIPAQMLEEVTVVATRAGDKTPVAFSNITKQQLQAINHGKDMPAILNMMPSVTTSSDAGTGIGYTGIHVRGTDPTRINVSVNGVPVNDAESSQLYWVNMGDFASSVSSIQLQRGVGTSTNGPGAFGATLNMLTEGVGTAPYAAFDVSAGSYGTHKETLRFSTGLLHGAWGVQGRLSNIASDGYIDRAQSRLGSYFLQAGYYGAHTVVKLLTFNGKEKTRMAWDYASRADMERYGRTYNPSGQYIDNNGNIAYYKNQTDNYHQQHYQLLWNQWLSTKWNCNVTLHYTHGDGYYEQYKTDQKLYKYLIPGGLRADLVRQKKMNNNFWGAVTSFNFDNRQGLALNMGGAVSRYDGDHYGKVLWVGNQYYWDDNDNKVFENPGNNLNVEHRYYDNSARKIDGNIYAKLNYEFVKGLNAFIDLQYRHVKYTMDGSSQEFDDNKQQIPLILDRRYNFFNPKVGLSYHWRDNHTAYASFAIAHKEPTRNDFEDMLAESEQVTPRAERLNDLEVGYRWSHPRWQLGANIYYMDYDNQFVLTGAQDSNGEMVARNIKDSYRLGLELTATLKPVDCLLWQVSATLSRNRARHMMLTVINDDWTQSQVDAGSTRLAYSPDVIVNNLITFTHKGFRAMLTTKYVGKQNMTNSGFERYLEADGSYTSAVLDPAFVSDLDLSYTFHFKWLKSATVGVTVYNLFNEKYDSNGSCSMNFKRDGNRIVAYNGGWAWSTFSAQAPIHFLAHLSLNF